MEFINPMKELLLFLRMMASDDNGNPSSSRGIGLIIFTSLSICVTGVTATLLYRITQIQDAEALKVATDALIRFAWMYLIMAGTALSLYGINVWKYIAQIRTGVALPEPTKPDPGGESEGA